MKLLMYYLPQSLKEKNYIQSHLRDPGGEKFSEEDRGLYHKDLKELALARIGEKNTPQMKRARPDSIHRVLYK